MRFLDLFKKRKPEVKNFNFGGTGWSGDYGDGFLRGWTDDSGLDPSTNSAVMACMGWLIDTLPEPPTQVLDAKGEVVTSGIAYNVITRPNPDYFWSDIVGAVGVSLALDGNAFLRRRMTVLSQPQLEWVPSSQVEVKKEQGGTVYILTTQIGEKEVIGADEMIHFRSGIDPNNRMRGISRLRSILSDVMADDEITSYYRHVLKNLGIVGGFLSPTDDKVEITPEVANVLKERFNQMFTGKKRGGLFVASAKVEYKDVGMSPDKLALKEMSLRPEQRICAALRLPPQVIGLGAGLVTSTYANMKEAREMAVESCNGPIWAKIATTLTIKFQDWKILKAGESISFDLSVVRSLQEDETAKAERASLLYEKGVWKRSEARTYTGQESTPDDEVYKTDIDAAKAEATLMASEARNSQKRAEVYRNLGQE